MGQALPDSRPSARSIAIANIPTFLGLIACVAVPGVQFLDPTNIAWIRGDAAAGYLGWAFYRSTGWSLPVGLNFDYGLELGSSIVYSDSVPLFAVLFKILDPVLPAAFQYFGIWILLCLVGMAHAAWLLLGLRTHDVVLRSLGTAFFVLSPVMLWRLHPAVMHVSLVAQFLLVLSLWLVFKQKSKAHWQLWALLAVVATAIHAYFLPAIFLALFADLADRYRSGEAQVPEIARAAVTSVVATLVTAWLLGYTAVDGAVSAWGYGYFQIAPLTLVDPDHDNYGSWSRVLPDIADTVGRHEGFGYLGLGLLALSLVAVVLARHHRDSILSRARQHRFFILVAIILTLFATTHVIVLGDRTLTVPVPSQFVDVAQTFRASARMFWLPYYMIVFAIFAITIKGLGKRVGMIALSLALVVQVIDTSHGWQPIRSALTIEPSPQWVSTLQDDFWDQAAKRYARVVALPPRNVPPNWQSISQFAVEHGMSTDLVYVARYSQRRLAAIQELRQSELNNGQYQVDNLYILSEEFLPFVQQTLRRETDMLARIDGVIVLAPGWKACTTCGGISGEDLSSS